MTVQVGHPAPPLDSQIEKAHRVSDDRLDLALEEFRVPIREVGRASVAKLAVDADFGELVEKGVQFSGVERIAELPDQAGFGPGLPVLVVREHGETGQFDVELKRVPMRTIRLAAQLAILIGGCAEASDAIRPSSAPVATVTLARM